MEKKCIKCEELKQLDMFYKHKAYKDGHRNLCIECCKQSSNMYKKQTGYNSIYNKKNKEVFKNKAKVRYNTDINYRLCSILRKRLNRAIKGNYKIGSAVSDLGCSIEDFKKYFESMFLEGMTWDNYGKWHIDHIKPLSSFNLNNPDEFKTAVHYTNLQPLWAEDNLKKSNRY